MASEQPRMRLEMPFLLMAGMVISAFAAGVAALAVGIKLIIGTTWTALFGDSAAPALTEKLEDGSILMAAFTALIGVIAWGLWREKPWTRALMVAFWALTLVSSSVLAMRGLSDWSASCSQLFGLALAGIYLYGKTNVKAYYRALESKARSNGAIAVAQGGPGGVA